VATIDDLTSATTDLLDAVTVSKSVLDQAVDQTSNNLTNTINLYNDVLAWTDETKEARDTAGVFATNASNSAVSATARANEAISSANAANTAKNTATTQAIAAENYANDAMGYRDEAEVSANTASAAAVTAFSSPSTSASSSTSNTIGLGELTFTIETGKNFVAGMSLMIASGGTPTANWMHAIIDSYNSATGALVVWVDLINGTGTFTSWVISLTAPIGIDSVNLVGVPTVPTAAFGTDTNQIASTSFVIENAVTKSNWDGSAELPVGGTIDRDVSPSQGYLRFNTDLDQFEGYDGTSWIALTEPEEVEAPFNWVVSTADVTTAAGRGDMMDTSAGVKTVTLHSPVTGDIVAIGDLKGTFATNVCTILTTGLTFHGDVLTSNMILDRPNMRVTLMYTGSSTGWVILNLV